MLRLVLTLVIAAVAYAANPCVNSGNPDTDSSSNCAYLGDQCTLGNGVVPAAPSGYAVECENPPCTSSTNIAFDRIEGEDIIPDLLDANCANTVQQCATACDAAAGCCGFNFVFDDGQNNNQNVGRCVGKTCAGRIGSSRYGMVYYERTAGAVAGTANTFGNAVTNAFNTAVSEGKKLATGILIAIIVGPSVVVICLLSLLIWCCCCKGRRKATVVGTTA